MAFKTDEVVPEKQFNIFLALVLRSGMDKLHVRITNREEPDQTASTEAV